MSPRGRGEQRRVRRRRSEQVSALSVLPLGPFSCTDLRPLALAENWCLFLRPKPLMGQMMLTAAFWRVVSQLRSLRSLEEEALPWPSFGELHLEHHQDRVASSAAAGLACA